MMSEKLVFTDICKESQEFEIMDCARCESILIDFLSNSGNLCAGVLVGLCAGDRNGGAIRQALRLGKSLLEEERFCKSSVAEKYLNWFRGPPDDTEKAFDTGTTFYKVFQEYNTGTPLEKCAERVQKEYGSIGVQPAHRSTVIAMAYFIKPRELPDAVFQETWITHANKISYEVSLACNVICRELINFKSWKESIETACNMVSLTEVKQAIKKASTCTKSYIKPDGYAPNVLTAALFFLHNERDFDSALNASILFAGPSNFCPVLVGAIGGARYGAKTVLRGDIGDLQEIAKNPLYEHCCEELLSDVIATAHKLGVMWPEINE